MAEIKRPKLDGFTKIIDQWLLEDLRQNRKQRHTAKRVFERLRGEHGFKGGYTTVKNCVREHGRRSREMFVPLAHAAGPAQADFGEAMVVNGGVEQKVHFFALDLPFSDAFFGRVPQSVLYDNDRCPLSRFACKPLPGSGSRRSCRTAHASGPSCSAGSCHTILSMTAMAARARAMTRGLSRAWLAMPPGLPSGRPSFITRVWLVVRCSPSLGRRMLEFSGLVTATGWLHRRDNAWQSGHCIRSRCGGRSSL